MKNREPAKTRSAFLTGSHAYGEPVAGSDVDMVIYGGTLPGKLLSALIENAEKYGVNNDDGYGLTGQGNGGEVDISLTFGGLNLIIISDALKFDAWKDATKFLEDVSKTKPVTREFAIETIEHFEETARDEITEGGLKR